MNIERIRQALTDELGEGEFSADETVWEGGYYLVYLRPAMMGCVTVTLTVHGKENLAAIGRALQSAAGEGPLIPLADAVRVVEEAIEAEQNGWACSPRELYALASASESITAALQALGGGGV